MASARRNDILTPLQEQILHSLTERGGSIAYRQLFRAYTGFRWDDMPPMERNRYAGALRGLERRGLVEIERRWGAWGYGQPELVKLAASTVAVAKAS